MLWIWRLWGAYIQLMDCIDLWVETAEGPGGRERTKRTGALVGVSVWSGGVSAGALNTSTGALQWSTGTLNMSTGALRVEWSALEAGQCLKTQQSPTSCKQ